MEKVDDLIPEHLSGVQSNTETTVEFDTEAEAIEFYNIAGKRLLNVNSWHDYAGSATADFQLTDSDGREVEREPQPGDHFRISIPAPGPVTGDGYDWVRIEAVEKNENETVIRVRPTSNPTNDKEDIAHFFSDEATSSFVVRREQNSVTAGVYGRNEKPNFSAEKVVDKIRNAAVATGAAGGFSKLQWKSLVNGLMRISDV